MANVPCYGGSKVALNISTPTQVFTGPGYVGRVHLIVEPTANGAIYDTVNATTPAAVSNQIGVIPYQPGEQQAYTVVVHCPVTNGLYVDPGTGGTVTVVYDTN